MTLSVRSELNYNPNAQSMFFGYGSPDLTNNLRAQALRKAQDHADDLFTTVEANGLIRPGISENQLNEEIYSLAEQKYGITKYWHKRIVRAGSNTLLPYEQDPRDFLTGEDDTLFLDLVPVFEEWEADFGRTFVIGSDPAKIKLRDDIRKAFEEGKEYFEKHPNITAAELYRHAQDLAPKHGWEYGGPIAGHLIGQFPHERIPGDKVTLYVHPNNPNLMRDLGSDGQPRHWILEIHFIDRAKKIGGFYEQLLTVD